MKLGLTQIRDKKLTHFETARHPLDTSSRGRDAVTARAMTTVTHSASYARTSTRLADGVCRRPTAASFGTPPRVRRAREVQVHSNAAEHDPTYTTTSVSPALSRARGALLWRASDALACERPLDVYTEALVATVRAAAALGETTGLTSAASQDADLGAQSAETETGGLSGAEMSAALDHLAFDSVQQIMETFEVEKGIEVMGVMRQVVVVSAGYDSRAFRVPWPRGTAVFELAHPDVHQHSAKVFKELQVKPPRGCSLRRVPSDTLADTTHNGDLEEKLSRQGYSPEVPSVWILQDCADVSQSRWVSLVEEACDLMCASSVIIGHLPSVRIAAGDSESSSDDDLTGKTQLVLNDLATSGVRAKCYAMSALGFCGEIGANQVGIFKGTKVRPSAKETEYYAQQVYLVEHEHGDEEGFES